MKKHSKYAQMGLRALKRAADRVAEDAIKNNYKIPVWEEGKVKYITPEIGNRKKK